MSLQDRFKADVKQFVALLLMLVAIGVLSVGEIVLGLVVVGLSAVVSIGGLFYDAHRADLQAAKRAVGAGGTAGQKRE